MSRLDFPDPWPCPFRGAAGLLAPAIVVVAVAASVVAVALSGARAGDGPAPGTATASPKEGPAVGAKPGHDSASGATPTASAGHLLVDGEIETLERGSLLPGGDEALRLVVRDQEAWKALWERIHSADSAPPPPAVDWKRDMVIAVSAGKRSTAGYSIIVRGSNQKDEKGQTVEKGVKLAVVVETRVPKPGAIVAQQVTHPFHVVRHLRFDGEVAFEEKDAPKPRPR